MFDIIIQPQNSHIFNSIKEVFTFTSNLAVTSITLYTAWLRFFRKRIDIISLGMSSDRHIGDVASFVIENRTLANFTVSSIEVVLEDKYIFQLKNFQEPFVIEPFKAYKIKSNGITDSDPVGILELNTMVNTSKCYCIVNTSRGQIKSYFKRYRPLIKPKEDNLTRITSFHNYFNGKALNKNVKYALSILCESGNYKDILIDNTGFMSDDLYGINKLPAETVKDFKTCYEYFKQIGIERGLTFYFYNVAVDKSRSYIKFVPPKETP